MLSCSVSCPDKLFLRNLDVRIAKVEEVHFYNHLPTTFGQKKYFLENLYFAKLICHLQVGNNYSEDF